MKFKTRKTFLPKHVVVVAVAAVAVVVDFAAVVVVVVDFAAKLRQDNVT